MERLIIISIFTLLFQSCTSEKQNTIVEKTVAEYSDTVITSIDSLILDLQNMIEQNYATYCLENDNYSHPELNLKGEISYEDEHILIISFSEVLKFGSWHSSFSSFFFRKSGESTLERIISSESDTITGPNWDKGLAYPGRINGKPFYVVDLNGDQQNDFIFESLTTVRSTEYTSYSTYFLKDEILQKSVLYFSGEMDQGCGVENIICVEHNEFQPLIEVTTRKIKCDDVHFTETKIIESEKKLIYQWNEKINDLELSK